MKKILVIGKYYAPFKGGIEHVTQGFCEHLSKSADVTVLASSHDFGTYRDRREILDGVKILRLATPVHILSQPISPSMIWNLRVSDWDLIQFHAPNPFAATVLWFKYLVERASTPLTIVHHMDIAGRSAVKIPLMPFYRALCRRASWVAVTSMKNFTSSDDIPKNANIEVIPLYIDTEHYEIDEERRQAALAWRASMFGDRKVVGFVGRHARYKGLDVLIRALALTPDICAVVAGDGPFREQAEQLSSELGLRDRVKFIGRVSDEDKLNVLASIDAFVFPSTEKTEAFGISQLEAMAAGAPLVSSNLPTGVTDVAVDEVTALVAEPGDPIDLAGKIARIVQDEHLASELRENAKSHLHKHFSRERVLAKLSRLSEDALLHAQS